MRVQETLDRLGLYWKRDPDFVPVKDKATVRLNVSLVAAVLSYWRPGRSGTTRGKSRAAAVPST